MKGIALKKDIPASIVVFLVALPLCLGVALASGAPLLSGIIAGVIGGIVVGSISGSHNSVSGPAAGLAAVVLSAITSLGSFPVFLVAVFIAGALQLAGGIFKAGFIANYIPNNVIKGLLAAIGIILILKQIPQALGNHADVIGDFSFWQLNRENTFSELYLSHKYITPGAILISVLSLVVLIVWDKTPLKKFRFFPAPLFVVLMGIGLNYLFRSSFPWLYLDGNHLVKIPAVDPDTPSSFITFPQWSAINNVSVWISALTIAILASLETLINVEALEKIDPHKRQSPPNRELVAQGIGNMVAGLVGALPVTSVVVRSSVNINSDNRTKLSTILHGIFLLLSVLFLSPYLNLIPIPSLAAILLYTGYKLASMKLMKDMYKKGWNQFIPFIVTIIAIVFTDLLIGVLIGLAVSLFFLLRSNYRNPFLQEKEQHHIGEVIRFELSNQVSFLNKATIKDSLWEIPEGSKVVIDATYSDYIDNDVLEVINDFKTTIAPEKGIQLNILGLKEKYQLTDHIEFINVMDKNAQQSLSPADALELLKKGNERFVSGNVREKYLQHQLKATSGKQHPVAIVVSCIDSRTSPEIIFDAGLGEILSIRVAGNIISPEIIGSIELSVKEIGAKLIVIAGHSACGAVGAACANLEEGKISSITQKIRRSIEQVKHETGNADVSDPVIREKITKCNADNSLREVVTESIFLQQQLQRKTVGIVACYYDTSSGAVEFGQLQYH
ncbi:MAG: bifunctional SulP family inorganic anion transporter/carbonic anhydrase [Williamsia sp.]|nr:bifunctional SulP family inorganic anion transporter/carbonic anhydrase [Williamsia sp.]